MTPSLRIIDNPTWLGDPIPGVRLRALLHALAEAAPRGLSSAALIECVWDHDDVPANPRKALQVLVSRLRAATAHRVVESTPTGYRLGLDRMEVDLLAQQDLIGQAEQEYASGRFSRAREAASQALELGPSPRARRLLALACSADGRHAEAVGLLEGCLAQSPHDEETCVALLQSLAAAQGSGAALVRFEQLRRALLEELASDPGPRLRAVHQELLAASAPVLSGVKYDPSPLLGRDADIAAVGDALGASRLVSIVGAGGLGKTRLAHAVARASARPVVFFVELAAAGSADDVADFVLEALGAYPAAAVARGSVVRTYPDAVHRISRRAGLAPTLLVLDNCEHVVGAVAELVSALMASVPELQVLTTTRAPLLIAGESTYALGQLGPRDACELFTRRARAARPGVELEPRVVRAVVARLDGLPLAIELAAAQVRAMSVQEIGRRLDDRFGLLQGGQRTAPDRHRTLLAVIDWSWGLLDDSARAALMRLSVFRDGFTLGAAESVLGEGAVAAVRALVDQSLVTVHDDGGQVRFRMLETVREFGLVRLTDVGLLHDARNRVAAWARQFCSEQARQVTGPDQAAAAMALFAEDPNLVDTLRRALAEEDLETSLTILSAFAPLWFLTGNPVRLVGFLGSLEEQLAGWEPPTHLRAAAQQALSIVAVVAVMAPGWLEVPHTHGVLAHLAAGGPAGAGVGRAGASAGDADEFVTAMCTIAHAFRPTAPEDVLRRLRSLSTHEQRLVSLTASGLLAVAVENTGDPGTARQLLVRALELIRPSDGPLLGVSLRSMIALLFAQIGDPVTGAVHARQALAVARTFPPSDDVAHCHAVLALAALELGNPLEARTHLDAIRDLRVLDEDLEGRMVTALIRAELALATGDLTAATALLDSARTVTGERWLPDQIAAELAPWALLREAAVLAAYAWHLPAAQGRAHRDRVVARVAQVLAPGQHRDFPVLGSLLFAVAAWDLLKGDGDLQVCARLMTLAERFGYNRFLPSLRWDPLARMLSDQDRSALARAAEWAGNQDSDALLAAARTIVPFTVCADN